MRTRVPFQNLVLTDYQPEPVVGGGPSTPGTEVWPLPCEFPLLSVPPAFLHSDLGSFFSCLLRSGSSTSCLMPSSYVPRGSWRARQGSLLGREYTRSCVISYLGMNAWHCAALGGEGLSEGWGTFWSSRAGMELCLWLLPRASVPDT